jgi:hypothetical protein
LSDAVDDTFLAEPIETGIVTATVNPGLTPAGREAAKALVQMPDLRPSKLAALARDIAYDIMPWPALLAKHQITQDQYDFLSVNNEFFKSLLAGAIQEWQSIKSTEQRVRMQSLAAYEELLPQIAGRMGQTTEKLVDVVEGAKLLAKTGGLDAGPNGPRSGGEGFTISIDLGADTKLTIGPAQAAENGPAAASSGPILANPQGAREQSQVQGQLEGSRRADAVRPLPAGECPPGEGGHKP